MRTYLTRKLAYIIKYLQQRATLSLPEDKLCRFQSMSYLCSVSLRYFSLSAVLKRSSGFKPSLQVFTFWLSTYTSYRSFFSSKIFSVVPNVRTTNWDLTSYFSVGKKISELKLTCDIGELILQGADVGHVDVEEGAELGHDYADPRDGDVCKATAAVHWQRIKNWTHKDIQVIGNIFLLHVGWFSYLSGRARFVGFL